MNHVSTELGQKCILLDADGVLQSPGQPFAPALEDIAGPTASTWLERTFRSDGPVITGRQDALPLLARFLGDAGARADPKQVYDRIWQNIVVHDDVLALVDAWRASGHGVYLATNQDPGRAEHMKTELGYDRRMNGAYYSCDLGVGKPAARYFQLVLEDLGVEPERVVFIDDSARNVAAARAVGINAMRWERGDDLAELAAAVSDTP